MKMTMRRVIGCVLVVGGALAAGICSAVQPLPANYTALEWISSDGNQWIDTGYLPSAKTQRFELRFMPLTNNIGWGAFCGSFSSNSSAGWLLTYSGNTEDIRTWFYNGEGDWTTGLSWRGQVVDAVVEVGKCTFSSSEDSFERVLTPSSVGRYAGSVYLFTANRNGGLFQPQAMRCYSFKIYDRVGDEDVLVRDFVPCRTDEEELGLWDRVSGTFYRNRGIGHFYQPGDDLAARVSYLQSSGTEYINTGYALNANTARLELDARPLARTGSWAALCGAFNGTGSKAGILLTYYEKTDDLRTWFFNTEGDWKTGMTWANQDIHVELEAGLMTYSSKQGQTFQKATTPSDVARYTGNFYLFAANQNGSLYQRQAMRLSSCRIFENNGAGGLVCVRDWYPERHADGAVVLTDHADHSEEPGYNPLTFGENYLPWGGIAYREEANSTLRIFEGTLEEGFMNSCDMIVKDGRYVLAAGEVTNYPRFSLEKGTFSLQDGTARTYDFTGIITLTGGAHLAIDLTPEGCDTLHTAYGVVFQNATAANPVYVDITKAADVTRIAEEMTLIATNVALPDGEVDYIVAKGFNPFRFKVVNGQLIMYSLVNLPLTATWIGDKRSPASFDLADPANWCCTNALGEAIAVETGVLPTDSCTVILPDGCTFRCPKGSTLAAKEVRFPATLGGDSDWSGLSIRPSGHIDLLGHKLTLADLYGTATIVDTQGETYQRLEFIESTSAREWIDTGYSFNNDTEITCDLFAFNSAQQTKWSCVFGSRPQAFQAGNTSLCFFFYFDAKYRPVFEYNVYSVAQQGAEGSFPMNTRTSLAFSNPAKTVSWSGGGVTGTMTSTNDFPVCQQTLAIFDGHTLTGAMGNPARMRLYNFRISEKGTMMRDFVPARRTSDGAVGLIDLANGEAFYGNAGTAGAFVAGPVVPTATRPRGEVHIVTPENAPAPLPGTDTLTFGGAVKLVKEGAGTFVAQDSAVAQVNAVDVLAGTLRLAHGKQTTMSNGGEIYIAPEATLDINVALAGNETSLLYQEVTHGKTLYVAGSLVNNLANLSWGPALSHVKLLKDVAVGSETVSRMDLRVLYGSANTDIFLEGPFTLTAQGRTTFGSVGNRFELARLDNRTHDEGELLLAFSMSGTITNGIHCYNGSTTQFYGVPATGNAQTDYTFEEGTARIKCENASTILGNLLVRDGVTVTAPLKTALTWRGGVTNNGEIATAGAVAPLVLTGRLCGSGRIAGPQVHFAGDETCWCLRADETGFTEKVDFDAVTDAQLWNGLKRVEVVYTGRTTEKRYLKLGPVLGLSTVEGITLQVTDGAGADITAACRLAVSNGEFLLCIGEDVVVERAVWTGNGRANDLSDPANWSCTTGGATVPDAVPMSQTTVVLPDDKVFNCTEMSQLVCKTVVFPSTLCADCDWRGLRVPLSGVIDLRGHSLTLSSLLGEATITDTVGGDYDRLQFIESSGTQWINTGYLHRPNTRIEMDVWVNSYQQKDQKYACLFGGTSLTGTIRGGFYFQPVCGNVSVAAPYFYLTGKKAGTTTFPFRERLLVTCANGSVTWGETKLTPAGLDGTLGEGVGLLTLFAYNNSGNSTDVAICGGTCATMRLFSTRFWEGGTLVRDYVPVRRRSDGVVGLLDQVTQTFLTNGGTGAFIPGPMLTLPGDAGGELHVVVPEGAAEINSSVALMGRMKFIKEGAGALTFAKAGGDYAGGTVVRGGRLSARRDMYAVVGTVRIESGAVFDINGAAGMDCASSEVVFTLAGGTLANYGGDTSNGNMCVGQVVLEADSFFDVSSNFGLICYGYGPTSIDLGGHRLAVNVPQNKTLYLYNADITAGQIVLTGGGTLRLDKTSVRAAATDFDLDCALTQGVTIDVHDWVVRTDPARVSSGAGLIRVHGAYTPATDAARNVVLMNGSTLDFSLRARGQELDGASLAYAEGSTLVNVRAGAFGKGNPCRLVHWDAPPEGVQFVKAPGSDFIVITALDGLYAQRGLMLILR